MCRGSYAHMRNIGTYIHIYIYIYITHMCRLCIIYTYAKDWYIHTHTHTHLAVSSGEMKRTQTSIYHCSFMHYYNIVSRREIHEVKTFNFYT